MNRIILSLLVVAMLSVSASYAKPVRKTDGTVEYSVLHHYFHNNDAPMPESPLITTREEFDSQFGMAAVMGEGGQPTPVNFRKRVVLAIVLPVTEKSTTIDSVSVRQTAPGELTLAYTVHEGVDMGYSIQPVYLMSIDRGYRNCKVNVVPTVRHEVKQTETSYQFVNLTDSRHGLNISVDYPTGGNDVLRDSLLTYLNRKMADVFRQFCLSSGNANVPEYAGRADGKSFVKYYSCAIADSMDAINSDLQLTFNRCWLQTSLHRTYEDDRVVSYEASGYAYMGGAHGLQFCDGATFDKATGRRLTLLGSSEDLLRLVTDKLRRNQDLDKGLHFSQEPVPMPKAEPYLTGDGKIKFVYQPYEIGPYAMGMPSCDFYPWELEKWLTGDGKMLLR